MCSAFSKSRLCEAHTIQEFVSTVKIGVQGCSYAGKMALFGGAFDERVALTVVQESGGGGINSWRTSEDFTKRTGTDIEKIDNTNYAWFMNSMQQLDPYSLPHDHHELIAMIAPRPVIALGNQDFEWLGDESGYKSVKAAQEVWKALGVAANIGFDFTTGHPHCQAAQSQVNTANAFVNRFLKDQNANTAIEIQPPANGFDLNQAAVIDWTSPRMPFICPSLAISSREISSTFLPAASTCRWVLTIASSACWAVVLAWLLMSRTSVRMAEASSCIA